MVDFLDIHDSRINRVRRVYDMVALRQLLPDFDT
jgi:hypothetical protein